MTINIIPVLCNEKNMANYAYIIHDTSDNTTLIVDTAEPTPIIHKLEDLNLTPSYILTTHHHFDHVGANEKLKEKYNLKVIAPETEFNKVPAADIAAKDNTPIKLNNIEITPILAKGHTKGHVLYHLPQEKALFTGDVLFNLCVGGLFEGTPKEMFESLQKIKSLPDDTLIYPGHEYTRNCIEPYQTTLPMFDTYLQKMFLREKGTSAPATLQEEKLFNPYLQASTLNEFIG